MALEARIDRAPPAAPSYAPTHRTPAHHPPGDLPSILAPAPEDGEPDPFEARLAACKNDETLLAVIGAELHAAARHLGIETTGPP